jgi:hypothetical protein
MFNLIHVNCPYTDIARPRIADSHDIGLPSAPAFDRITRPESSRISIAPFSAIAVKCLKLRNCRTPGRSMLISLSS